MDGILSGSASGGQSAPYWHGLFGADPFDARSSGGNVTLPIDPTGDDPVSGIEVTADNAVVYDYDDGLPPLSISSQCSGQSQVSLKTYFLWQPGYYSDDPPPGLPPPPPATATFLLRTGLTAWCNNAYWLWPGTSDPNSATGMASTASVQDDLYNEKISVVSPPPPYASNGGTYYTNLISTAGGLHLVTASLQMTNGKGIYEVTLSGSASASASNSMNGIYYYGVIGAAGDLRGSAKPVPRGLLNSAYINKDSPVNTTYQSLPTPAVLYGGSVRFTSDELHLNAADTPPVPGTTYTWSVYGPGSYTPPSSGPAWNVVILPTPGSVRFECLVQPPGAPPVIKALTIEVGIRTDDTIMVGWIDRNSVAINPTNVDAAILADLPPNGGTVPNVAGTARLAALADNNDYLDYLTLTTLYSQPDKDYILDWMFHFANNPDPTPVLSSLQTADVTDPTGLNTTADLTTFAGYMNYPKLASYMSDGHRFKLLNHFQVKYRVNLSNIGQFNGAPIILQRGATIGATVNPTGVPPDFGSILNLLASLPFPFNLPGLAAAYANHTLLDPQPGPANGLIGPTPAVSHISQCNDGSPEIPGIRAFNTLTGADEANPLFWQNIGSKITFTCGATGSTPTNENYPTYYYFYNGVLSGTVKQAPTPNGHFYPSPYPFGTDPSFGLPPRGPGDIPLLPGIPSFPTLPGGRNGFATLPPDDNSVPIPPYTVP